MVIGSGVFFLILFVLVNAILQKVVFLNKKSGFFFFYSRFQLLTSRQYEKWIFQATTIFSSISWVFRRSVVQCRKLGIWKLLLMLYIVLLKYLLANAEFLVCREASKVGIKLNCHDVYCIGRKKNGLLKKRTKYIYFKNKIHIF